MQTVCGSVLSRQTRREGGDGGSERERKALGGRVGRLEGGASLDKGGRDGEKGVRVVIGGRRGERGGGSVI